MGSNNEGVRDHQGRRVTLTKVTFILMTRK